MNVAEQNLFISLSGDGQDLLCIPQVSDRDLVGAGDIWEYDDVTSVRLSDCGADDFGDE